MEEKRQQAAAVQKEGDNEAFGTQNENTNPLIDPNREFFTRIGGIVQQLDLLATRLYFLPMSRATTSASTVKCMVPKFFGVSPCLTRYSKILIGLMPSTSLMR